MVSQGDLIKLDFDPHVGTEQSGFRPALVVSGDKYHRVTNKRAWVCPISKTDKNYPIHIRLDDSTVTEGVVLCDQIKTVDLVARGFDVIEKAPEHIVWDVLDVIDDLFS